MVNVHLIKKNVVGGYVLTCLGDSKRYSYLKSKSENSLSDKMAIQEIKKKKKYKIYNWMQRGSDERQYNSPGVELNLGSLMRSKYETFKEYHTSEDELGKFVNKKSLNQSFNMIKNVILNFENSIVPNSKIICEPHLSKRNLYSHINIKGLNRKEAQTILDFLSSNSCSSLNQSYRSASNNFLYNISYKSIRYLTSLAAYSIFASEIGLFNQSVLHDPSFNSTPKYFFTKLE